MAPRGRIKKGMMRDDAARDAMIEFGFEMSLINETIKELLELYDQANANPWKLMEEGTYSMLFERLLEKQKEQENQLTVEGHAEQENELAVEEQAGPTQEEEVKEQERHVEEGRDRIGSCSTALLGYDADTGAQSCQTGVASVTNETTVMDSDSLPPAFQSGAQNDALAVIIDSIPAVLQSGEATAVSVGGTKCSHGGWVSSDSESEEDGDNDDGMVIQPTAEPPCEELTGLVADMRGDRKRKRPT